MKSRLKSKITVLAVGAGLVLLIGIMLNSYGQKGTMPLPPPEESALYSWKNGSINLKGSIIPDNCLLASKNCECNLSAASSECSFNLNLQDLSDVIQINFDKTKLAFTPISYTQSAGCTPRGKIKQITNCRVNFKWDKSQPAVVKTVLQLEGAKGVQTLVNLRINAK